MKLHPSPGRSATLSALYLAIVGPCSDPELPMSVASDDDLAAAIRVPAARMPGLIADLVRAGLVGVLGVLQKDGTTQRRIADLDDPRAPIYLDAVEMTNELTFARLRFGAMLDQGADEPFAAKCVLRFFKHPKWKDPECRRKYGDGFVPKMEALADAAQ